MRMRLSLCLSLVGTRGEEGGKVSRHLFVLYNIFHGSYLGSFIFFGPKAVPKGRLSSMYLDSPFAAFVPASMIRRCVCISGC